MHTADHNYELIQIFNRIGAVAPVETNKRHVQHVVGQTVIGTIVTA